MSKLNKQSYGVGKYLKYHKEKVTGGNLPNLAYDLDWKTLLLRRLNRECAWGDMEPTWASKSELLGFSEQFTSPMP